MPLARPRRGQPPPETQDDFAALFLAAYGAWVESLDAASAARLGSSDNFRSSTTR